MASLNNPELENIVGETDLKKEFLVKMLFKGLEKHDREMDAKIKDEDKKRKKIKEMLHGWKECSPELIFLFKEKFEGMLK